MNGKNEEIPSPPPNERITKNIHPTNIAMKITLGHSLLASAFTILAAGLLPGTPAGAAIIGINPANSFAQSLFDDTASAHPTFGPGTTLNTLAVPSWTGAPVLQSVTDPATGDSATTSLFAFSTATSYGVFLSGTQLVQQTGNTGFAEMTIQFSVEYVTDVFGLPLQPIMIPSISVNGTVQPGISFSFFRGTLNYVSGSLGVIDQVNYLYSNTTPGPFATTLGGTPVNGVPFSLPANDTLTLSGFYTFRVDPASINAETVPEPTAGVLGLLSLPLLWRRR